MKKLFLTLITAFLLMPAMLPAQCVNVPYFYCTATRPVKPNQLIQQLAVCDPDIIKTFTLAIIAGDPKKYFFIDKSLSFRVRDYKAINRNGARQYRVTIQVRDSRPPYWTNQSIILLTVK